MRVTYFLGSSGVFQSTSIVFFAVPTLMRLCSVMSAIFAKDAGFSGIFASSPSNRRNTSLIIRFASILIAVVDCAAVSK